ncbi:hypothetical protein JCM11251_005020 [Rhodosporidiobolus azoricus]
MSSLRHAHQADQRERFTADSGAYEPTDYSSVMRRARGVPKDMMKPEGKTWTDRLEDEVTHRSPSEGARMFSPEVAGYLNDAHQRILEAHLPREEQERLQRERAEWEEEAKRKRERERAELARGFDDTFKRTGRDGSRGGGGRRVDRREEEREKDSGEDGADEDSFSPPVRRRRDSDHALDPKTARGMIEAEKRRRKDKGRARKKDKGELGTRQRDERSMGKGLLHPLEGSLRRMAVYG